MTPAIIPPREAMLVELARVPFGESIATSDLFNEVQKRRVCTRWTCSRTLVALIDAGLVRRVETKWSATGTRRVQLTAHGRAQATQ